jgi:hypothetical protein
LQPGSSGALILVLSRSEKGVLEMRAASQRNKRTI